MRLQLLACTACTQRDPDPARRATLRRTAPGAKYVAGVAARPAPPRPAPLARLTIDGRAAGTLPYPNNGALTHFQHPRLLLLLPDCIYLRRVNR